MEAMGSVACADTGDGATATQKLRATPSVSIRSLLFISILDFFALFLFSWIVLIRPKKRSMNNTKAADFDLPSLKFSKTSYHHVTSQGTEVMNKQTTVAVVRLVQKAARRQSSCLALESLS